ncbi:cardiolipin synthetase 2 [Poseidonocella pacifica]|uniref:Phospholipase D n=1 Tax=Poseidonocella pacifica TaxID=871651 RepID=A0A1I0Y665_9RHOB|nr:phospholipase D-like domain-containing protein [Poseidonocella pacifica]SFB07938.1 cardiolipin synthetase 2 [Poseidonocella pacifica]
MNWILSLIAQHGLVVLSVLLATVAGVFVLQQRRTPQSMAAWLLFIVVFPYLALPVFLMLGFRKQGTRFPPLRFTDLSHAAQSPHRTAETFRCLGAPPATDGNKLRLHDGPADALASLEAIIADAQDQIDVLLYILDDDASGKRFVAALTERAKAGVAVRINIDRLGSLSRPRRALRKFVAAGGELRFFSPFLHPPDNGHMNLRNHRKLVLVDNRFVWAGGRNIGNEYLREGPKAWYDLSFSLSGPAVQSFIDLFASDWDVTGAAFNDDRSRHGPAGGEAVLQLVPAGPDEPCDALHHGLVNAIHGAQRRVWITTPYFVPTEALTLALETAARRGLDVRLMVPGRSNKRVADLARGAYLRALDRAGGRVLRHEGMLHAKAGLIDDAGWIGTANFDVRSMLLNFEYSLFLYDPQSVASLEGWIESEAARCTEGVTRPGLARRILEGVFRLSAPML